MNAAQGVSIAVTFIWLGMVAAISFVEAPLKFRAPNVTLRIGLGIGRLVFRALNRIELVFAVVLGVAVALRPPSTGALVAYAIAVAALVVQLVVVRPRLNRRSDEVLAGAEGPRSHGHYYYVGLETIKMFTLLAAGILLLSS